MEVKDTWVCVRDARSRSRTDLWWKWWTSHGMKAACSAVYAGILYQGPALVKTESSTVEPTTKSKYISNRTQNFTLHGWAAERLRNVAFLDHIFIFPIPLNIFLIKIFFSESSRLWFVRLAADFKLFVIYEINKESLSAPNWNVRFCVSRSPAIARSNFRFFVHSITSIFLSIARFWLHDAVNFLKLFYCKWNITFELSISTQRWSKTLFTSLY